MNTRMTTLAASATLAVFVAAAYSADGRTDLGGDRDNASSSLQQASATAIKASSSSDKPSDSEVTPVRMSDRPGLSGSPAARRASENQLGSDRDNASGGFQTASSSSDKPSDSEVTPVRMSDRPGLSGSPAAQAASDNQFGNDRDNAGIDEAWTMPFPSKTPQGVFIDMSKRPVLTSNMPEAARRAAVEVQFDTVGGYLLLAGDFTKGGTPRPQHGRCGTDDYIFDTKDNPSLSGPRVLIELPLSITYRSAEATFISAGRPSAAFDLMEPEFESSDKPSSGLVGTFYIGSKRPRVLGTFRMTEGKYEFASAGRVSTSDLSDGPIYLGLGGNDDLEFAGEICFEDMFQITDADGNKAGDVRVDDDEEAELGPFGDLTGDGLVNQGDFVALMNAWGTSEGDLNHDGTTNGVDLGLLLEHLSSCWG